MEEANHLLQNMTTFSYDKAEETFAILFPKEINLISANNLQHYDAEHDLKFLATASA